MSRNRKMWVAVMVLGALLIPIGVLWMVYAIGQTGSTTTSGGVEVTISWWPIVAFFVAFLGGTLISVGMLGWMFSWFSGDDDDDKIRSRPSEILRSAVPRTKVGWGGHTAASPPD
jgi:hypothetical protein